MSQRVLIIDDVISAGTSVRESVDIIQAAGAKPAGVVIALDRQERGKEKTSAIQEVEKDYGLKVASIVGLQDLIQFLGEQTGQDEHLAAIQAYRTEHGVE